MTIHRTAILATLVCAAACMACRGEETRILSFGSDGTVTWSNRHANSIQSIEWASSLSDANWSDSWVGFRQFAPRAGTHSVRLPLFYRVMSRPVSTNLPGNATALLARPDGSREAFESIRDACEAATPGDTVFLSSGIHDVSYLAIATSNLTFVGPYPPAYDVKSETFASGCIWDGTTRILTTTGLRFINVGFQDSAGGDPFVCDGKTSDERDLHMTGCAFAGTATNDHNALITGRHVRINSCASYNGGHNFAFKTFDLSANGLYSWNGRFSGVVIKGETVVGDLSRADLSDIVIEGPAHTNTACGLHVNAYYNGARTSHVRVHGLRTRNVNIAVYINPQHPNTVIDDVTISDAESHDSYQFHGDYVLQPGATNVTFVNCRSYNPHTRSFVNYGAGNVRLVNCRSSLDGSNRAVGPFTIKQVNNEFLP